jgi:parvulin-like peptidyl-prolyl isomerase
MISGQFSTATAAQIKRRIYMSRWPSIAVTIVFGSLCLTASAQEKAPAAPAASPSATTATPASTQQESNVVVLRVSGEPITEKQVLSAMEALASQNVPMTPEQQKQRRTVLFKGALDNLITSILLKNEAKKQNVTVDKAKIDQQFQQIASQYPSQEAFQKTMARLNMTEADVRKNIEESMSMQAVIDLAVKDVPAASDADIQKFYDSNPDKFAVQAQAHVAQIFLKIEPTSTLEQKAEIKKKLEDIRADIESKKITFADAAAKFSQDSASASKGGDLGYLSRNENIKSLEDIIFATPQGGMTTVMEAQNGFYLLQVIELKPEEKVSPEAAKPQIKQYLDKSAKQRALRNHVDDLKSKAVIETFMTAEEFDKRHPAQ